MDATAGGGCHYGAERNRGSFGWSRTFTCAALVAARLGLRRKLEARSA
jgi:hypothetical protein